MRSVLLLTLVLGSATAATAPPHILSVIVDDLGRYDTQVTNPNAPTPTIGHWPTLGSASTDSVSRPDRRPPHTHAHTRAARAARCHPLPPRTPLPFAGWSGW